MESQNLVQHLIIQLETRNVSATTELYMIYSDLWRKKRKLSGQIIYRNLLPYTILHHTLQLGFRHIIYILDVNLDYL